MKNRTTVEPAPLLRSLSEWTELMWDGDYHAAYAKSLDIAAIASSLTDDIARHGRSPEFKAKGGPSAAAGGLGRFLCMPCVACERAEADE